jgi:hypothetical protein
MHSSRRKFLKAFGLLGVSFGLVKCHSATSLLHDQGVDPNASVAPQPTPAPVSAATVEMQDVIMEGWSTLGSGFLGFNGALKTKYISANKTVELPYTQDSHGHKFTLTPANFADLRKGKIVEVFTTIAQGHKHMVRMNPKKVDKNSPKVTMLVDIPSGDPQPQQQPKP